MHLAADVEPAGRSGRADGPFSARHSGLKTLKNWQENKLAPVSPIVADATVANHQRTRPMRPYNTYPKLTRVAGSSINLA
ncbi:hypothetical protein [Janthinobacterium agaricidamnosum]|uniref:Uncharacterized protein n=1 Tax=Janthinobacterium agaricidamnosum NBRC 102515 = DSM 9628 TaxID=1349767 RepID=W0V0Y8_9BURK|nr:hypothetical protein [Janthinobacterium agaricidamnosum]CDG80937.1 hypothetical protein GJA_276 [Janthinobacterium agaricidamnosum NBRC 102515 = DSM 9628]